MTPIVDWRRAVRALRRWTDRPAPGLLGGLEPSFMSKGPHKQGKPHFLFVALFDPAGISTIREQVEQWCELSEYRFDLLNLWGLRAGSSFRLPSGLRLSSYDGLVMHCTAAYELATLLDFEKSLPTGIAQFRGAKAMMKQDEHFRTHRTAEFLGSRGFHVVITMAKPSEYATFYPQDLAGSLRFIPGLTGFISKEMRSLVTPPLADRPIDVGYRGSLQPWNFGRLAWEKREIGETFLARAAGTDLLTDISSRWEDRFTGKEWFRFLGDCRAILGVESGASIIDYDGEVHRRTADYLKQHPDASFEEVHRDLLQPFEDNGYYRTVSPRHFEAAASGCVQVLYEGEYAGIFKPREHFVPLRRDFANFEDVVRQVRDLRMGAAMVERAMNEIVRNPEYSYEKFVRRFDAGMQDILRSQAPQACTRSSVIREHSDER